MKSLNRHAFFLILVSGLFLIAFQNCSNNVFNSISSMSAEEFASLSGPQPRLPASPVTTATLSINPSAPPNLLSESGLQTVQENQALTNFKEYVPQYPLYSDGSSKRRWIYLPAGSAINSSNPDEWIYPKGTILWKEFSFGGNKIETRVWEKIADGIGINSWRPSVYAWKADQSDAVLYTGDFYQKSVAEQMQYAAYNISNQYKVLNTNTCTRCHSSAQDVVNGFNYLQLSKTTAKVNIFSIKDLNWLTNPPLTVDEIKGSNPAKAAIGYMQANCATCHNGVIHPRNFKHTSNTLTYADENIVREFAKPSTTSIPLYTYADPSKSLIYVRQGNRSMPPTGLFVADPQGQTLLAAWINDPTSNVGVSIPVVSPPLVSPGPTPAPAPGPVPAPAPTPVPSPPVAEPPMVVNPPTPVEVKCDEPKLGYSLRPPGSSGSFLQSTSSMNTSAECQGYCIQQIGANATYSNGQYGCQYVPATATGNAKSICAITAGTWTLADFSNTYEAAYCYKR
ncbi:MAG: hypothetical protein K0R29_2417 [Pseudobdellovibrio sp.]|jgi:hypothetical protein|nr:hypothetical protein [Pseudobdellovibrio sp.]